MDRLHTLLRRFNLPVRLLATHPPSLFAGGLLLGLVLAIWSVVNRVGVVDATVVFSLLPDDASPELQVTRDLPLGYIQQLNYGPWFMFGLPILLTAAAMAWRSWNRACDCEENGIPKEASLDSVSRSVPMSLLGIAITLFLIGTSVLVEVRDYNSLGLGWVQLRAVRDAAAQHLPIPGNKFRNFAEAGRFRRVQEASVRTIYPPEAGVYNTASFIAFVCVVKAIGGIWQALVIYLSLLFLRVGARLVRHVKTQHLYEREGAVQWTITPAILMFFVGALTNVFSSARYVANMAKGSYGSWDQYASLIVISPGLATSILGIVALYLVYFEAQGRANPWAGTPQPLWWALGTTVVMWIITGLGVVRLLIGLHPSTAQQVSEWLQHSTGVK